MSPLWSLQVENRRSKRTNARQAWLTATSVLRVRTVGRRRATDRASAASVIADPSEFGGWTRRDWS
jgi:hypothetical protein